jgi:DNA-binding GntR family transcriptional regulator
VSTVGRTVLREQVKDALLQRILRGDLEPGDRLVETRIAQELGTSQAPVREALRDLELLRLVESQPFKGARVRALGDEELIEIYPVRAVLEELAAKLATPLFHGDVRPLEHELEAMRTAAGKRDLRSLVQHDFAFHRVIVQTAANDVLEQSWRGLGVEGRITLTIYGTAIEPEQAAELHAPIVEAIGTGNTAAAGREARRHVEHFARIAMRSRQS